MRSLLSRTWIALVPLLGACAVPIEYDYRREPDPRKLEYVIGVGDALKITVWKNPELSADARVRPDGTITLPLLGDLTASARTPGELKREITTRLSAYVKDEGAVVTIAVTDPSSYRVTVNGNVEHPGVFSLKYFVTVTEAIALAGGPNKFASPRQTVIVRSDKSGVRRIPIDYFRASSGEHPEENLALFSSDTVYVP
jgi:polysaccharide export outer membrane protein